MHAHVESLYSYLEADMIVNVALCRSIILCILPVYIIMQISFCVYHYGIYGKPRKKYEALVQSNQLFRVTQCAINNALNYH